MKTVWKSALVGLGVFCLGMGVAPAQADAPRLYMGWYQWHPHSGNNPLANFGTQYHFGRGVYGDTDGDGVTDDLDQCPGTPKGVVVDAKGCPVIPDSDGDGVLNDKDLCSDTPKGQKVNASGCPLDSDGDGVIDDHDQCPNTPHGTPVDAVGCPKDRDQDGDKVTDTLDKCPDTPKGATVTAAGCWVVKGLNFDTDSATLKQPGAGKVLDGVVGILKDYPDMKIEIQGHTDTVGSAAYNLKLSQKRAEAVRKALVDKGLSAKNLSSKGYGYSVPVAPNATPEGRAENRRVEVNFAK
ncbi:MAG: OmpA family protein [Magnetococcales bacterium]|nr:OmpA family protein [Magnetococcales bacterium]